VDIADFQILDLLRAVSALSCLKIFYFPERSPASSNSGVVDKQRSEQTPKWPDSLETFHIPCSLDRGYIIAFEKTPALLKNLIVNDSNGSCGTALEHVFDLVGPQIQTLRVQYENCYGELSRCLQKFPNLLHLYTHPELIDWIANDHLGPRSNHPLRSITIAIDELDDISNSGFLECLEELVNEDRLSNIRSLILSIDCLGDHWESFLRQVPLPVELIQLLDISKRLKRRSSSESGRKKSGVFLVDSKDDDAIVCEFTEESCKNHEWGTNMNKTGLRKPRWTDEKILGQPQLRSDPFNR
jgi:hypothetical protein